MTTRRFIVAPPLVEGEVLLSAEEARHLTTVLRARVGEVVSATDGAGAEAEAEVAAVRRDGATLRTTGEVRRRPRPPKLELWCAFPRAGAADDVVRVAAEIGATSIRPLVAVRGVWRADEASDGRRGARFLKAAQAAIKQSHGTWLPEFPAAVGVEDLHLDAGEAAIFGSLAAEASSWSDVAATVAAASRVVVLVGPEGGFVAEEEAALRARGATPIRLVSHVLRVETAVIALLAHAAAARFRV